MAIDNRDPVGRGLELVASGLGPFVDTRMTAAVPEGQGWVEILAARDSSRYGAKRKYSAARRRIC